MSDVYKSSVGLKNLYLAQVNQDDASAYAAGTPFYLAPAVTASTEVAANSKTQYAEDQPFDAFSSEGESKITLEVTGIPLDVLAQITGRVYDIATGRLFDNAGVPPYFALAFQSQKSNGKNRFYQYLKCRFSMPSDDKASKTDSPDPKTTKLICTAIKTTHPFDLKGDASLMDGSKRVLGDEDMAGFNGATWFNTVQIPVAGAAPALTCTPSPADGAVGQAVGVAITLTFSNALSGGAELGIGLLREDTEAAITVTRSINAARTVVTLAHPSLVSTKKYLITVNGVKDVFGQTLADAVYDFTVA